MKGTVWTVLAVLALCVGCSTPITKQQTCDTAAAAYAAYMATIEAGREPSKEEIYAAAAAGAFLRLWCGWEAAGTRYGAVDANGVPNLRAP